MIDTHRARVEGASREERIGCDAVLALRLGLNQRLDQTHVLQSNCHCHHRRPASASHLAPGFFWRELPFRMKASRLPSLKGLTIFVCQLDLTAKDFTGIPSRSRYNKIYDFYSRAPAGVKQGHSVSSIISYLKALLDLHNSSVAILRSHCFEDREIYISTAISPFEQVALCSGSLRGCRTQAPRSRTWQVC